MSFDVKFKKRATAFFNPLFSLTSLSRISQTVGSVSSTVVGASVHESNSSTNGMRTKTNSMVKSNIDLMGKFYLVVIQFVFVTRIMVRIKFVN